MVMKVPTLILKPSLRYVLTVLLIATFHPNSFALHFLATDPRVPRKVRDDMQRFGLPSDEFPDTGGWPHQLYIREARRMVSDLVMTEHHTFGREIATKSIGLGSYGTDVPEIRRIVKDGTVCREGKTWPVKRLIHEGPSAYSRLAAPDGSRCSAKSVTKSCAMASLDIP